jgi:hypothetical protein
MTLEERLAEFDQLQGILEIDFDKFHKRMEEIVGRPVWRHEFARPELLREEMESGYTATLTDVLGKIPKGKKVIVVESPRLVSPN